MSLPYSQHPDLLQAAHPAKRRFSAAWPTSAPLPCKRPRRVLTPGSVISELTHEDDDHPGYRAASPLYASALLPELLPVPEPEPEPEPEPLMAPLPSPPPPPRETSGAAAPLRSDADILADVHNSFAGGCASGSVTWSPELLVQVLANEVEDVIYSNEERGLPVVGRAELERWRPFFSSYKQPFELDFYMRRLVQYVNCSTSVFVTMFVYLDRVQERCKALRLCDRNCHRLVFTCLVLAVKYLEDEVHSNAYYARVGGLTVEEMNSFEVELLQLLDWKVSVSPETYAVFEEGLMQTAALLVGGAGQGGYGSPVSDE